MSITIYGKKILSWFPLLDGLFRRFIWSRIHFPEIEMRLLHEIQPGLIDVAVDVGAALGSYSWILNRISKQVYAFEPGLSHNKYINRVIFGTNIKVIRSAVGSTCDQVGMYTLGSDSHAFHSATLSKSNPIVNVTGAHVDQVDQVTLDSFLAQRLESDRTVDVLKVDVEGYELEVFKGAFHVLSQHLPLIICEIEARHNANYRDVFVLLRGLGYECYIFRKGVFELFSRDVIEDIQLEDDLNVRLSGNYDSSDNRYINNFIFQHPQTRIKVIR
jgi:FkbM family methyltransferase